MARLSLLTRPDSVHRALDQFRAMGRDAFLEHYGFARSRDYFIQYDGRLYDSKPIVAAAFGFERPELGALRSSSFSGGAGGAIKPLARLGFQVVTSAQLHPPELGDEYASRTVIQDAYGGQSVQGIVKFPGDTTVNAFSDEEGPYADEPPTAVDDFGYRGDGLKGHQRLDSPGNRLLESARSTGSAVRFWYRPTGGKFRFWCWVAVVGRAWVVGRGSDGGLRREIEWRFISVHDPDPTNWPLHVLEARSNAILVDEPEGEPGAELKTTYSALCSRVGPPIPAQRTPSPSRFNYQRNATARRAVLERSAGQCENPECTGMPSEVSRSGKPILEVDHVQDLARHGDDHPRNMIALCPNCHAVKTRGKNAGRMRGILAREALRLHERALGV